MNISNTKNLRQINRDKVMDIFKSISFSDWAKFSYNYKYFKGIAGK